MSAMLARLKAWWRAPEGALIEAAKEPLTEEEMKEYLAYYQISCDLLDLF